MIYSRLGNSGLQISRLSFGSWVTFHTQVNESSAESLMSLAFEHGVNFFDNAEVYAGGKSEELMGLTLKKMKWPRLKYLVSTKFFWGLNDGPNQRNTLNRKYLMESMEHSLKRLQLDHVDLVYAHRPDPQTPLEETVRAMNDLIVKGQALYWGTSEWSGADIRSAYDIAKENGWHKPVVEQPQYNLFERRKVEVEYQKLYADIGLGLTTWSPLASGVLTGKYLKNIPSGSRLDLGSMGWLKEQALTEDKMKQVRRLTEVAQQLNTKPSQLAIAWCLKNPHVSSVILGASGKAQLQENLAALDVLPLLTDSVHKELSEIFPLT